MKRRLVVWMLFGVSIATAPAALAAAGRHLVIIVDTSGSMQTNDRQRYTMQLSQVLSDLLDNGDELSVIRMPGGLFSFCSASASSSLVLPLDQADRAGFKRQLDGWLQFNTGTWFAAPIRTAISLLPRDADVPRMLLVIADSGGLGSCEGVLTQELLDLKRSGVTIAAINLGGAGAFDSNPAFDFTTGTRDAQELIEAVALVYQRFLGAKKVQTGRVQGEISVEIAPYVDEAFLVVAADGPIGSLEQVGGNPGAAAVDLNHRGGGATMGLDGVLRGYRIVRLDRPGAGRWRFRAANAGEDAGWMLLQDSAVGVRAVSSPTVPRGLEAPIEVELFDQRTGRRIADTSKLPGLQVDAEVDGRKLTFHDDGKGGDRAANDGILTATTTFDKAGDSAIGIHLQSEFLDRRAQSVVKVIDASWRLEVRTPKRAEVDRPLDLAVALQPIGSPAALRAPERVDASAGGAVVALRGDGNGVFTGRWTPSRMGTLDLQYAAVGGSPAAGVRAPLEVFGRLRFGPSIPVRFGRLTSKSERQGQLDLTTADVRGAFNIQVSTTFKHDRSALEIDLGNGWVALNEKEQTLHLADGSRRTWPLRLRVGECPQGNPAGRSFDLVLAGTGVDGHPVRATVPVSAEIVADTMLRCWWPAIALGLGLVASGIVIHGFWFPSRFAPRLGVVLSPEEDVNEGFFHPIRAQRGSGSGFYRDARVYICQDFRVAGRPHNAVARLRADRKLVRIEPASGAAVWRRNSDGVWEQIPPAESTARFGDLYRNDSGSIFFELRNA